MIPALADPWRTLLGMGLGDWLRRRSGWSLEAMNEDAARAALQGRLRATGLPPAAYWERLQTDENEARALLDALLVQDTRFFRDRAPFQHLTALAARRRRPMRVLSLPCASGEEALSCAIALHQGGLSWDQLQVTGVDLSHGALERAREGRYPRRALNGLPPTLVRPYFHCDGLACRPIPALRRRVRYLHGSLLDPPVEGPYDAVLCRNLLLYFAPAERARALEILHGLLAPDGVLYLGHAESGAWVNSRFRPLGPRQALAWRARGQTRRAPVAAVGAPSRDAPVVLARRGAARRMQKARRLYEQGRLEEAVEALRGLAYLYPQHWYALDRLAAWSERLGNERRAHRYRRWAQRILARREGGR